jgi:glucosamine-6-phosphate deaminase
MLRKSQRRQLVAAESPVQATPAQFQADRLTVQVHASVAALARAAAGMVRDHLQRTIEARGEATAVLATGNAQIEFLAQLTEMPGLDWSKITLFHLDEYAGLGADHPASFQRYLRERVAARVTPRAFHFIQGDAADVEAEIARYTGLLRARGGIDLVLLGVGAGNGHLAFNDPHVADRHDPLPMKRVVLDEANRQQQVTQGHFPSLEEVPRHAFTLTLSSILGARKLVILSPGAHKAAVLHRALRGAIDEAVPASLLRTHPDATLFVDPPAVALIRPERH